jgi:hypothetical protein
MSNDKCNEASTKSANAHGLGLTNGLITLKVGSWFTACGGEGSHMKSRQASGKVVLSFVRQGVFLYVYLATVL